MGLFILGDVDILIFLAVSPDLSHAGTIKGEKNEVIVPATTLGSRPYCTETESG